MQKARRENDNDIEEQHSIPNPLCDDCIATSKLSIKSCLANDILRQKKSRHVYELILFVARV